MKKLFLLSFASILFFSCSESEDETGINAIPKAEIVAIVNQTPETAGKGSSSSNKDVKRGNIYPWVSEVDMTFSQTISAYSKAENFKLVKNNKAGAAANFVVKDIALGPNEVVVTTKTDSDQLFQTDFEKNGATSSNITQKLEDYKTIHPYVLYNNTPFTQEIKAAGPNIVNVDLTTNHGRRISSLKWANDAIYKTEGYAMVSFIDTNGVESSQYKLEENDVAFNYWSNEDALDGNKITIKAEIYSNNGTLIDTFTREIEVTASTSTTCSYIIKDDKLFRESKIVLTFQEWIEINCTDC